MRKTLITGLALLLLGSFAPKEKAFADCVVRYAYEKKTILYGHPSPGILIDGHPSPGAVIEIDFDSKILPKQIMNVLKKVSKIDYCYEDLEEDYWQTPEETEKLKKGDCDDQVFYSKKLLNDYDIKSKVVIGHYDTENIKKRRWIVGKGNEVKIEESIMFHMWIDYGKYILDPVTLAIYIKENMPDNYYVEVKHPYFEEKLKAYSKRTELKID